MIAVPIAERGTILLLKVNSKQGAGLWCRTEEARENSVPEAM